MATNFYLDSRSTAKGENSIRVSINVNGTRFVTNSGFSVFPKYWDSTTQSAKARRSVEVVNSKGFSTARLNGELANIAAYWQRIEANATESPTAEQLREMWQTFKGRKVTPKKASYLDILDRYSSNEGRNWSDGTQTKWLTFCALVKDSDIFSTTQDIANPSKVSAFVEYLRRDRTQKDTTVSKYFAMLCRVVRFGERCGDFASGASDLLKDGEKFTKIAQPVIYLEKEELLRFIAFDCSKVEGKTYNFSGSAHQLNPSTLEKVRDLFCFCALTSLRFSDGIALTWGAVANDKLTVTTLKTADTLTIALNDKAKSILDKRRGAVSSIDPEARVFEPVNNVTANSYLKVLGYLCGVSSPIARTFVKNGKRTTETQPKYNLLSTHAARRTFIVTALSLGIAPAVVMKFTGHSNYAAMRPYIDITQTAQAEAMEKFNAL